MRLSVPSGIFFFSLAAFSFAYAGAEATGVLYGHSSYSTAQESTLAVAGRYRETGRKVRLTRATAAAFKRMRAEASKDAVELVPISGFRTPEYQRRLFERAITRYGDEARAARWVAPPGFSEHHTGRAVDIGELESSECDVDTCFVNTRAYAWLVSNASRFDFLLSFPDQGPGGAGGPGGHVSFEPWHWRFEG